MVKAAKEKVKTKAKSDREAPGKRLSILKTQEIDNLYRLPQFTDEERQTYFYLTPVEQEIVESLRTTHSKLYFILQLGYFKAKKQCFVFDTSAVPEDLQYIIREYFPHLVPLGAPTGINIPKMTRVRQHQQILKLFNYRLCTKSMQHRLYQRALQVARVCTQPVYLFRDLMAYLENHRVTLPGYSTLQNIIGKALTDEEQRLEAIIQRQVPAHIKSALEMLLTADDGLYEITLLKRDAKDFSYTQMKQEIHRRQALKALYHFAQKFLSTLELSNENIRYYAGLVEYYTVYKLKRMSSKPVYMYLLCFVFNRFGKINDNLIHSFIYYTNKYENDGNLAAKQKVYELKTEGHRNLKSAGKILNLFIDNAIPEQAAFKEVKEKAFSILDADKFPFLIDFIGRKELDEGQYEWDYYDQVQHTFKKNLRQIFLNIDFECQSPHVSLITTVAFLKTCFHQGKSLTQIDERTIPVAVIPSQWTRYLYQHNRNGLLKKTKEINVNKYEFMTYRLINKGIESGSIYVKESIQFKSLEDDLIDDEQWQYKEKLLAQLEIQGLCDPIAVILSGLEETLEPRIQEVNQRIREGGNPHFKLIQTDRSQRWSLGYPKNEETCNDPLFEALSQISIIDLMNFTQAQCGFLNAFTHILDRYAKNKREQETIIACIVAYGTNMGLAKMADISDMEYASLASTANNFIRLETLKEANDTVSNAMSQLPIFMYYNVEEDRLHSSSDGQKFETRIDTIKSRYSPKYFGLNKGISACTLVANHIPINAKIIGANEHESHFVFDLLFNNTSDIDPQFHSTDTHGTNEVNFAILQLFGYQFAPRYKNLRQKVEKHLYGFKTPVNYANCLLKPVRKINTSLIQEEWDNIQRIAVSLAMKATTQSIIIRKLSSFDRQNQTKKALWEYDNIIRSIYLLNYIDDANLRRNVQRVLNRGEAYHQLRRAVAFSYSGQFRVRTELEQEIWNECARLLANLIIFFNGYMLSQLLQMKANQGNVEELECFKRISPIAWRHINLYGRYEFQNRSGLIDIDDITRRLQKVSLNKISK